MSRSVRWTFLSLGALAAAAATPGPAVAAGTGSAVTVSDGWFRYITPQVPAGGYMRLDNHSRKQVELVGAASPGCGMLMMHHTERQGGAETMMPVDQVPIPPDRSVAFAPGGYHLMCMTPRMRTGQHVPVTLRFNGARTVTADFAVFGAAGKPAGH